MALSGWLINNLASVLLGIEVEFLGSNVILGLYMATLGFLIIGLSTLFYPYTLIPSNINVNAIIVSHIESGLPLFSYYTDESLRFSDTLLSGSIRGVISVLEEVTNDRIPTSLTFMNYQIIIEQSPSALAYAFSESNSEALSLVLKRILQMVEDEKTKFDRDEGTVILELTSKIQELLATIL
jgi:hypothetical protein